MAWLLEPTSERCDTALSYLYFTCTPVGREHEPVLNSWPFCRVPKSQSTNEALLLVEKAKVWSMLTVKLWQKISPWFKTFVFSGNDLYQFPPVPAFNFLCVTFTSVNCAQLTLRPKKLLESRMFNYILVMWPVLMSQQKLGLRVSESRLWPVSTWHLLITRPEVILVRFISAAGQEIHVILRLVRDERCWWLMVAVVLVLRAWDARGCIQERTCLVAASQVLPTWREKPRRDMVWRWECHFDGNDGSFSFARGPLAWYREPTRSLALHGMIQTVNPSNFAPPGNFAHLFGRSVSPLGEFGT